jgi:hypothetical protein
MELRKFIATTIREFLNEEINKFQKLKVNEDGNIEVDNVEIVSDRVYGTVRRINTENELQGIVYVHLYNVLKKSIIDGLDKNETLINLKKVTRSSEMIIEGFLNYIGLTWGYNKITENKLTQTNLWYHGTDDIFDYPKYINSGREIGFHLGNIEQALNIKNKIKNNYPNYINTYEIIDIRPLRMKDLKFWLPEYIVDELIKKGINVEQSGKGILGSKFYKPEDVLEALKSEGFDSIIYKNEFEGDGDSIIVFDDTKIKFLGRKKIKQKDYNHET